MTNLEYKQFIRRHRPHIHPPGALLFVTYRLVGSVPKSTVREYKAKKVWLENELKRARGLAHDNKVPELEKWIERLVHTIFKPFISESNLRELKNKDGHPIFTSDYLGLSSIMHSLKDRSARECNLILSRSGSFWEHESFDHVIRPGKFNVTMRYVLNNPVKAGLATHWREWPWNYCRKELSDKIGLSSR